MENNKKKYNIEDFFVKRDYDMTKRFEDVWKKGIAKVNRGEWKRATFENSIIKEILLMVTSWDEVKTAYCLYIEDRLTEEDKEVFATLVFQPVSVMNLDMYSKISEFVSKDALSDLVSKDINQRFKNFALGTQHLWRHQLRRQAYNTIKTAFAKVLAEEGNKTKISIKESDSATLKDIGSRVGRLFSSMLATKGWSEKLISNYSKLEDIGEFIVHVGLDANIFYRNEITS